MLKYLVENNKPLFWTIFHILLGASGILSPWPVIAWFYLVLLSSLKTILIPGEDKFFWLTGLIVYTTSFELIGRMSGASPFIPYEVGKYLLFVLLVFGIASGYRKGVIGLIMMLLLVPSVFFDESDLAGFKNIVFNLLGPVNAALAIFVFRKQEITKEKFKTTLRLLSYSLISVLSYVIIKTPDFADIEFTLGSNFAAAGGWGTNQVSTALGLGAFLAFIFWKNRWTLSGFRWFDALLIFLFAFRGLLTFSRGGMLGGALGILIILFYEKSYSSYGRITSLIRKTIKIVPLILLFFLIFLAADNITGGKLILRYRGETPGTLAGSKEKNLNTFTTNRVKVFKDDLKLWKEYPLLGAGVGSSFNLRESTHRVAAHVEISRLLSEHGTLGLIYFVLLLVTGFTLFRKASFSLSGSILLALFIIALFTTFHSAMRTFISPVLIGLSMLSVVDEFPEEQSA